MCYHVNPQNSFFAKTKILRAIVNSRNQNQLSIPELTVIGIKEGNSVLFRFLIIFVTFQILNLILNFNFHFNSLALVISHNFIEIGSII